ncbi:MAG TPA: autotransporter-associated beta strand repeat-containing protein, partial [Pirellulaceae bacterium]|nr:autotransporter-associated beta strand repeat-containing protein [Pirellulaceae bacterium]
MTFSGQTIATIAFNTTASSTASNITNALNPFFGTGNFTVTPLDARNFVIAFAANLSGVNLPDLSASNASLTGTSAGVAAQKLRDGAGNEVQRITLGGTSGGTVQVSYDGVAGTVGTRLTYTPSTSPTAAAVLSHLNSIPALNGNVSVLGLASGPFIVVFRNSLQTTDISNSAFSYTTGGGATAATASVSEALTNEADAGHELQALVFSSGVTGGHFTLAFNGYVTDFIPYSTTPATLATSIQSALEALPSIGVGNVVVTGSSPTVQSIKFQGALGRRDVSTLVAASALIGGTAAITPTTMLSGYSTETIGGLTLQAGGASDTASISLSSRTLVVGGNVATIARGGATQAPTLAGNLDFGSTARTFSVNQTANGASTDFLLTAGMSGTGGFTLNGSGTTELSGSTAITATGATTLNEGTLLLGKSTTPAILGTLTIGDGVGGPGGDLVKLLGSNQIAETFNAPTSPSLTIAASGTLDLNNFSDVVVANGTLTLNVGVGFSSRIQTGTGVLTLGGNLTVVTSPTSNSASPAATIDGVVDLGSGGTRTITVGDGNAADELIINAVIQGGGGAAGLTEGFFTNSSGSLNETTPNPGYFARLQPRMGETNNSLHQTANTQWVYTGEFFDADGSFAFAENIDDFATVTIDGVTRLRSAAGASPATTVTTTGAANGNDSTTGASVVGANSGTPSTSYSTGWHTIEIRIANVSATGGAVASTVGSGAGSGWTRVFGLGLRNATTLLTSTNGADYVIPTDPNNATLFRTLPTNLVTSGAGRLVLTGANTFQGATTVGQGELVLRDGGKALNTSALTVSAGAKLTLDNSVQ